MKKFLLLIFLSMVYQANSQIISQYIETESGTTPKGIEIWNNTASIIDITVQPLNILIGVNGAAPAQDFAISTGVLAAGDVMVVGTTDLQTYLTNEGLTTVRFVLRAFTFNGDDSIVIRLGTTQTDVFGTPGSDPGASWTGSTVSTANQNIQLKSGVVTGSTGFTDPSIRFETVSTTPTTAAGKAGFGIAPVIPAGNQPPVITNVSNTPAAPQPLQAVTVTATITDSDNVASALVNYGTTTGVYDQSVTMTSLGNDNFTATLPGFANGTTVYYRVTATDRNSTPLSSNSSEFQFVVMGLQPEGLQVATVNTLYTIDFDNTVENVNNGSFAGLGIAPVPAAGQLDSDAFVILGMSDGNSAFGDSRNTGDFSGSVSTGGVTSAGIYGFEVSPGNIALGFQPTGGDFTPGSLIMKFTNTTGVTITNLKIGADLYVYNNEGRSLIYGFAHGATLNDLVGVDFFDATTDVEPSTVLQWERNASKIDLTGLSIPNGSTYLLEFSFDDLLGSGSRDEVAIDNINIIANSNTTDFILQGNATNLTSNSDINLTAPLTVSGVIKLDVATTITSNGNLRLSSTAGKSAVIAPLVNSSISGNVIVEQFYPAKRAFRFVSPSVDMTSTIFSQWQQNGLNPGDLGYVPGVGIQITGGSLANGFDQTATNAPSAFSFNNATQVWSPFGNTNQSLDAGDAARVFIRGDRSVDLSSNASPATATKLISTGNLKSGDVTVFNLATGLNEFSLIGNPYQAQVDLSLLLNDASTVDVNKNVFYIWDPTIGERGAYSTFNIAMDANNLAGTSQVNKYLQPSQAVFFTTADADSSGTLTPAMTFKESYKFSNSNTTAVFNTPQEFSGVKIKLYESSELAQNKARDGVVITFQPNGLNEISLDDIPKITNLDENFSVLNGTKELTFETRNFPSDGEIIPLKLSGLLGSNYAFRASFENVTGVQALLIDQLTGLSYTLGTNEITIPFSSSTDVNRFYLKFSNETLGIVTNELSNISIYPNPISTNSFNIKGLKNDVDATVSIIDLTGKLIDKSIKNVNSGTISFANLFNLTNGVYLVRVEQGLQVETLKLIKN